MPLLGPSGNLKFGLFTIEKKTKLSPVPLFGLNLTLS